MEKYIEELIECFPKAFINEHNEMIIDPHQNTFFQLDDVESRFDVEVKLLHFMSRNAIKGGHRHFNEYHFRGICQYLEMQFTVREMACIYQKLGGGIKKEKTIKFIKSNYNFNLLDFDKCCELWDEIGLHLEKDIETIYQEMVQDWSFKSRHKGKVTNYG